MGSPFRLQIWLLLIPSRPTSVGRSLTALEGPGCGRQGRDDPVAPHLFRVGLDGADESQPSAHQRRTLDQDVVRRIRRLPAQEAHPGSPGCYIGLYGKNKKTGGSLCPASFQTQSA